MTAANDLDKVHFIQQTVAEYFNMDVPKLLSRARPAQIAWPRQIAMELCRQFTELSQDAVAAAFNKHDHVTVLWASKRVKQRYEDEPNIRRLIDTMKQVIMERFPE